MNSRKKSDPLYTQSKKRGALTGVTAMAAAGIAVFIIGLLLNDMSGRNLFTVIAVLFALPGAKFLTRLIILIPAAGPVPDDVKKTDTLCAAPHVLFSDIVVTSSEKVMYLDYIFVGSGNVFVLMSPLKRGQKAVRFRRDRDRGRKESKNRKKSDPGKSREAEEHRAYIEGYLKKGVRNWGNSYRVQVFSDREKFEKAVKGVHETEINKKEEKAVLDYIESIIV